MAEKRKRFYGDKIKIKKLQRKIRVDGSGFDGGEAIFFGGDEGCNRKEKHKEKNGNL